MNGQLTTTKRNGRKYKCKCKKLTSLVTKEKQMKRIIIFTNKVAFFQKLRESVVGGCESKFHSKLFHRELKLVQLFWVAFGIFIKSIKVLKSFDPPVSF